MPYIISDDEKRELHKALGSWDLKTVKLVIREVLQGAKPCSIEAWVVQRAMAEEVIEGRRDPTALSNEPLYRLRKGD